MGQVTDGRLGLGFMEFLSRQDQFPLRSFAPPDSRGRLSPHTGAGGIVKARAAPRKNSDRPNPPDGGAFDSGARWQAEPRRSHRNRR